MFYSNINSEGYSRKAFNSINAELGFGIGSGGISGKTTSSGNTSLKVNIGPLESSSEYNMVDNSFTGATNFTIFSISEVKLIGGSISLTYNSYRLLLNGYNNIQLNKFRLLNMNMNSKSYKSLNPEKKE